ncbi:MAG: hypothetical protein ACREEW_01805 [Caulobacteraceae bacterium]
MPDGLALPLLALIAAGMIAFALVWPQGQGAPSPVPFGHPVWTPPSAPAQPSRSPRL